VAIYLIATMDTKGIEAVYVRDLLRQLKLDVTLVDVGSLGQPCAVADVSREQVFEAAGADHAEIVTKNDRGAAISAAALGVERIVREAFAQGKVDGVLALGGSAGTTIGTQAMRSLPIGVPKLMVSTLASGQVRPWVGDKDILMLNSVVDIAGINRISRLVLNQAAAAMAGMVQHRSSRAECVAADKPLIAASMFGVTTPCVQRARKVLEAAGYEVLVFHATGSGGQAMESLIREGLIAGVLDITTTELADELVGGILSAGPDRLTAAGATGIPQVVSVGALDMVNFGPRDTLPTRFADRKFYQHNASVTLMRTTVEENATLGEQLALKLAVSKGPTAVMLPLQGVSSIDRLGQPFEDVPARESLYNGIQRSSGNSEVIVVDAHINDDEFAVAAANKLLALMGCAAEAI
jgi:uncharacterized protein (UPF0261 family)